MSKPEIRLLWCRRGGIGTKELYISAMVGDNDNDHGNDDTDDIDVHYHDIWLGWHFISI